MVGLITLFGVTLWSCNQNEDVSLATPNTDAARLTADSTGFFCRDSLTKVAVTSLPATVTSFISTSYTGATINYAAKDDAGNFLVAITQNGEPKALLFNADGTFNKELSLRGGKGGPGRGYGPGRPGRGADRDSLNQVAIANLPAAITSYITANFAGATIKLAAKDDARGYVVMITQDGKRRTLLFNADGTFSQEVVRGAKGNYTAVPAANLPAAVTSYVTTNYAGATIVQAGTSPTGQFLVWLQPASGRPIALVFAADGTFVQELKHRR